MKLLAVEVLADGGRFISDLLNIVDDMLHIQSTDNIRYTHIYVLVYFMHCVVKMTLQCASAIRQLLATVCSAVFISAVRSMRDM
jgi:uncharacterized membrane protein